MQLRPDQLSIESRLASAYARKLRSVCLVIPTGGGKTVIASHITQRSVAKGNTVLFLAHRVELLDQINATLDLFPMPRSRVTVASIQTIARRLDKTPEPDFIIVDEAGHCRASNWEKVLTHWKDAKILGLTATPQRLDGRGLGDIFQALVEGDSTAAMIADGRLCPYTYYWPQSDLDLSGVSREMGDFKASELAEAVNRSTIIGSAVREYGKQCPWVPAIAFCINHDHGNRVAREFRDAGWTSETLFGDMPAKARRDLVARYKAGLVNVLVTVDVATEGFDAPGAACAILLRPTESLSLFLQTVGRVLRRHPGKTMAWILDHVSNVSRHMTPDWPREWSLNSDPRRTRKGDVAPVGILRCPSCFRVSAPGLAACPECAHVFTSEERKLAELAGTLVEVSTSVCPRCGDRTIAGARCGGCAKREKVEEGMCRTLADWQALGRSRGVKPGWAWIRFNARGGFRNARKTTEPTMI